MDKDNIYAPPQADLKNNSDMLLFFPTSTRKLIILYIATFGLYPLYWFYKHWSYQKNYTQEKIWPIARAFFAIFFVHSLFKRINHEAPKKFSHSLLATVFVILSIASILINNVEAISGGVSVIYISIIGTIITGYPIYKAQTIANEVNKDPQGKINNKLSVYNYIFIALGLTYWAGMAFLVSQLL